MIKIAAKRIKDRHILWKEKYTERTAPLHKRYASQLGPGSYYRWEGHDYTTNSDYYIVCSPAQTKYGDKTFFAGIKKLPPIEKRETAKTYSPYGKYFNNISSALTFLKTKYGIPWPKNQKNYTTLDLQKINIPRFVKA
jgi:hypothetical protein